VGFFIAPIFEAIEQPILVRVRVRPNGRHDRTATPLCGGRLKVVVRLFVLPAVPDGLLEHAVLVPQPVALGGQLHRGHRLDEARGQASQTAVAQEG
jgi:hypothetical protein